MLLTAVTGEPVVILKADRDDAKALRSEHDGITPSYHMNRSTGSRRARAGRFREVSRDGLVTESYLLVVENLPRAKRLVDPASGRGEG
jgi:predicted DNA-binding protein (MmcQ/YjbR family)